MKTLWVGYCPVAFSVFFYLYAENTVLPSSLASRRSEMRWTLNTRTIPLKEGKTFYAQGRPLCVAVRIP